MSFEIDKSWHLMCNAVLTELREKAMMSLMMDADIPSPVIDYVQALEKAFLNHEFNGRRESCDSMWEQWRKPAP
jgi:hypothetical protein